MRVLHVDNDAGVAAMVSTAFALGGCGVETCSSVGSAAQLLGSRAYDAVVMERVLPDGDGLDLCRALRARGDATPVVVLSREMTEPRVLEAYAAGASMCLRKPIGGSELVAHVAAAVQGPTLKRVPFGPTELNV